MPALSAFVYTHDAFMYIQNLLCIHAPLLCIHRRAHNTAGAHYWVAGSEEPKSQHRVEELTSSPEQTSSAPVKPLMYCMAQMHGSGRTSGCRRPISFASPTPPGCCSASGQKTCFFPEPPHFTCTCTPNRYTQLAGQLRMCTCDAALFTAGVAAAKAAGDGRKVQASSSKSGKAPCTIASYCMLLAARAHTHAMHRTSLIVLVVQL